MLLVSGVDFVTPLTGLLIQILPTGKCASRQKVGLDEPEGPFYARRAVGMADLMGHKVKAETLSKGIHLGHRNHLAPRIHATKKEPAASSLSSRAPPMANTVDNPGAFRISILLLRA